MPRNPEAANYVPLVLKVTPRAKDLLRRFADEDRRVLGREFEHIMDEESARRIKAQTAPFGGVEVGED